MLQNSACYTWNALLKNERFIPDVLFFYCCCHSYRKSMELTVNTNSFTFNDCSLLNGKLNRNVGLKLKRLQAKHKNKLLKFEKWFSKEHDYCIPIKKESKLLQSDNEESDEYSEESTVFESDFMSLNSLETAANSEKLNVNYEHNSNAYAINVATESLNGENIVQPSNDEKSCFLKESTPQKLFSSIDIDNDMIKLFPNLDFSTEHISDEKIEFTESRKTNTDNIIFGRNKIKTKRKKLLNNSFDKTMPKTSQPLQIKSVKNEFKTDTILPNNIQRLFENDSSNLTIPQLASEQYLNILNRYQVKSNKKFIELVEDPEPILLRNLLWGSKPKTIISPYTQRHLKPYILRDPVTKPLWLQMLNELKEHNRRKKGLHLYAEVDSIDYSYVRAKHIGQINALARQFFWPGIDFTESLMYPDFSVVALYKNLIIGFGFMIPDIKTNENYITFLFTRPYWTNCGIAKFMIYHLIQTCVTRDITLHVSSNSPAVILYQKFGFKIEEFVQNFYENYISADSELSKNALFLRLRSTLQRK